MKDILFRKVIELRDFPESWSLVRLSGDWNGSPLLLFAEGKPARPDASAISADPSAFTRWYQAAPKQHHAVHLKSDGVDTVSFEQSQGISTFHLQRLESGWLLADRRGGQAKIYDRAGCFLRSLDLGDASEDLQTTPDARIWVSYFDEGVFGCGIGKQGAVCFDPMGNPIFQYGDFAEQNGLPFISDCYAMNATGMGDIWLNYYTDFPLVQLRDFALQHSWNNFGATGNGFAINDNAAFYGKKNHLFSKPLDGSHEEQQLHICDESGAELMPLSETHLAWAFRGACVVLNTGSAVYISV